MTINDLRALEKGLKKAYLTPGYLNKNIKKI